MAVNAREPTCTLFRPLPHETRFAVHLTQARILDQGLQLLIWRLVARPLRACESSWNFTLAGRHTNPSECRGKQSVEVGTEGRRY